MVLVEREEVMSEVFKWLGDPPPPTGKPIQDTTWPTQVSCPPGFKLDPTGKLCVPVPDTNLVMDFFNAAAAAAAPIVSPAPTQTVTFGEQTKPPQEQTAPQETKPPKSPQEQTPEQLSPPPAPPVTDETPKKSYWPWAIGAVLIGGVVWLAGSSAKEIGGALKLNPRRPKKYSHLAIVWSPANQQYFVLWPGKGKIEDQQVLRMLPSLDEAEAYADSVSNQGATISGLTKPGVSALLQGKRVGEWRRGKRGKLRANPGMTKAEAKREFEAEVLPYVVKQYGPGDKGAVAEAWNDWTDALHKDGRITRKQYDTWTHPY